MSSDTSLLLILLIARTTAVGDHDEDAPASLNAVEKGSRMNLELFVCVWREMRDHTGT
jgi:hypothetical protein